MQLRNALANAMPRLGKLKRIAWALKDAAILRKTYSQHQEDYELLDRLRGAQSYDIGYIDVGANHPTFISNTYLLYRKGYRGYLIEPNIELVNLCRVFRPMDRVLQMGIAGMPAIRELSVSTTPTISSFNADHFSKRRQTLYKSDFVPVLSLDQSFSCIHGSIGLLSIDVEGMNKEVLASGLSVARRAHLACIEHDTPNEARDICDIMNGLGFKHTDTFGCNQIFTNSSLDHH